MEYYHLVTRKPITKKWKENIESYNREVVEIIEDYQ